MKEKVITVYDTDTATVVKRLDNGHDPNDERYCLVTVYRDEEQNYFFTVTRCNGTHILCPVSEEMAYGIIREWYTPPSVYGDNWGWWLCQSAIEKYREHKTRIQHRAWHGETAKKTGAA